MPDVSQGDRFGQTPSFQPPVVGQAFEAEAGQSISDMISEELSLPFQIGEKVILSGPSGEAALFTVRRYLQGGEAGEIVILESDRGRIEKRLGNLKSEVSRIKKGLFSQRGLKHKYLIDGKIEKGTLTFISAEQVGITFEGTSEPQFFDLEDAYKMICLAFEAKLQQQIEAERQAAAEREKIRSLLESGDVALVGMALLVPSSTAEGGIKPAVIVRKLANGDFIAVSEAPPRKGATAVSMSRVTLKALQELNPSGEIASMPNASGIFTRCEEYSDAELVSIVEGKAEGTPEQSMVASASPELKSFFKELVGFEESLRLMATQIGERPAHDFNLPDSSRLAEFKFSPPKKGLLGLISRPKADLEVKDTALQEALQKQQKFLSEWSRLRQKAMGAPNFWIEQDELRTFIAQGIAFSDELRTKLGLEKDIAMDPLRKRLGGQMERIPQPTLRMDRQA